MHHHHGSVHSGFCSAPAFLQPGQNVRLPSFCAQTSSFGSLMIKSKTHFKGLFGFTAFYTFVIIDLLL